jgi:hypothetical protein
VTVDTLRMIIGRCYPWARGWEVDFSHEQELMLLVDEIVSYGPMTVEDVVAILKKWKRHIVSDSTMKYKRFGFRRFEQPDKDLSVFEPSSWQSSKNWHQKVGHMLNPVGLILKSLVAEARQRSASRKAISHSTMTSG